VKNHSEKSLLRHLSATLALALGFDRDLRTARKKKQDTEFLMITVGIEP
jgi:hypothetical protein